MSQPTKPTSEKAKAPGKDKPMPDAELEKVSGGASPSISEITITKHIDKSSPGLG